MNLNMPSHWSRKLALYAFSLKSLLYRILNHVSHKIVILRCFDSTKRRLRRIKFGKTKDFSRFLLTITLAHKSNASQQSNFRIKSLGTLPRFSPDWLYTVETLSQDILQDHQMIKAKLYPSYFPPDLIDQNTTRELLLTREMSITLDNALELTKAERMHMRCKKCNFIISDLSYCVCLRCNDIYHKAQSCISDTIGRYKDSQNWICPNCKACEICYSKNNTRENDKMVH